ncbi:hypothetical protein THAOC_23569 [Thalassiosira oceanica]|uniref:Uncharacterized protein n=1 Tax=Thalassiosira oceanica TaxID=159749 RepID=K0RRR9_THAOC|nr:hypothetical protein THAOC_23569 [Thalassiosira oceanica]|eukprot:EJK56528.1 hypothetical protein THAOC_23569 [Thalassiosira oceanica]
MLRPRPALSSSLKSAGRTGRRLPPPPVGGSESSSDEGDAPASVRPWKSLATALPGRSVIDPRSGGWGRNVVILLPRPIQEGRRARTAPRWGPSGLSSSSSFPRSPIAEAGAQCRHPPPAVHSGREAGLDSADEGTARGPSSSSQWRAWRATLYQGSWALGAFPLGG